LRIVHNIYVYSLPVWPCQEGKSKCRDEIQCVNLENFCDGYEHCEDGSDEDPELCRGTKYNSIVYHCIGAPEGWIVPAPLVAPVVLI
jgi:energy-converting hydrogenase Eha subunit B